MRERGKLIVLSGPSGVGKGTLLARYLDAHPETRVSVSATTRAPRPGEIEGLHYYYITRQDFECKIQENGMLEWARYNNNYYGTPRAAVEEALGAGVDIVLEIEVQGALQVRAALPEAVLVFVLPPSFEALRHRLSGRGTEGADVVERRLRAAAEEIPLAADYDFVVVNDVLEEAAARFAAVLDAADSLASRNQKFILEVLHDAQTYFVAN